MKHYYLVDKKEKLLAYQAFVSEHESDLRDYIQFLREELALEELPQAFLWADEEGATKLIRQVALPAYTNDVRLVMTPDLAVWKRIYLEQLASYEASPDLESLVRHYESLSENHLLQLIGHELAHWSVLFLDDFSDYETYIWFEEGMVEYISRRYFLTEQEFEAEVACNRLLVDLFQSKYGWHSLNNFGQSSYDGDIASIFYEYWRSFLTIHQLVEKLGSVQAVFTHYQEWAKTAKEQPLLDWFLERKLLKKEL